VDVQGDAVRRDPAGEVDADRRQLVVAHPDRRPAVGHVAAGGGDAEVGHGADQDLLEIAHVAADVAAVGGEVEDRVRYELPSVERQLAAAVGVAQVNTCPRAIPARRGGLSPWRSGRA
jgi:hypothetical protein